MTGLAYLVAGLLLFLAGMLTSAGLLAHYLVHADARAQRADSLRESALAADWRPGDCDISRWDTVQLAVMPAQRVSVEAVSAA